MINEAANIVAKLSTNSEAETELKGLQALFNSQLPGHMDVRGILKSVIRLQNTYNVTASEMASGIILGIKVPVLSAYDCYNIGVFVFMAGHTRIALQWLQTAKEKANNLDYKKETTISADLNDLIKEIERQDIRYDGVCKYIELQIYFFYKQPIKVEYINKSPMILIVHDIISQKLIKKLTGFTNQLKRSTVKNPAAVSEEDKNVHSEIRISSTYYFQNDTTDPDVIKLNDRLERLTGLRTNPHQADHLQVVNYGIGGEFQPHFDWMNDRKSLSDVQVGGSTVFPELGLAVSPVKGLALFSTNLDKDGHGDLSTLHAGCPVFLDRNGLQTNGYIKRPGHEFPEDHFLNLGAFVVHGFSRQF
ncbi:P4HA [Mytilus edulis]|uniref:P4HA n=1 Tax=Mytilus edulis TaxID=6550 RepID=A0A8S3TY04_MYTED|nr:P4HA [Mytilus edulis]